jgi:hypothetical protein
MLFLMKFLGLVIHAGFQGQYYLIARFPGAMNTLYASFYQAIVRSMELKDFWVKNNNLCIQYGFVSVLIT